MRISLKLKAMIETVVSVTVAVLTGAGVLSFKVHNRMMELDRRIDGVELCMARAYVSKQDFKDTLERVEEHMLRIENKLDKLTSFKQQ